MPKGKYIISLMRCLQIAKFLETVEWWLPGTGGWGDGELWFNGYGVSVWDDEQLLERKGVMVVQHCEYT